jgi:hypothetical protein
MGVQHLENGVQYLSAPAFKHHSLVSSSVPLNCQTRVSKTPLPLQSLNLLHPSHNKSSQSIPTPYPNKAISEFDRDLQSYEDEEMSGTLRSSPWAAPPQDYLTSLRRDTLNTLPVDLGQDQILVDYWFAELPHILQLDGNPSIVRMLSSGSNLLFSATLSSPEAFQSTILLWAMYHRAHVQGIKHSPHAERLRSSFIRWSIDVTNPSNWNGEHLEETGMALLSSANAECLYGDQSMALQFYDRGRSWFRRWRLSGSMWTSYHNVALKMLFWWYRVLNADSICCTRNYVVSEGNLFAHKHLEEDFETFWSFVHGARELAMQQSLMTMGSRTVRRRTEFRRGGSFHTLLQLRPSLARNTQRRRQFYCQFLVLCFVHAALLELKDSFMETETYLADLLQQTAKMDLTADEFPIFSLLWLFQEDQLLSYSAMAASVSAASQITLRLTDLGLSLLNSALIAYLELDDGPAGAANLPYLERTLFYGMVFNPDDWNFTASMEDRMPLSTK